MSSKTVLETLEAARKLITPEGAWTQGDIAKTSEGETCYPESPRAVCWCAYGAISRFASGDYRYRAATALERSIGDSEVDFNDTHTHAEVLAAFDAAIAKEKEAQHA